MVKEQLDSGHATPVLKLGNLSQNEFGTAVEVARLIRWARTSLGKSARALARNSGVRTGILT